MQSETDKTRDFGEKIGERGKYWEGVFFELGCYGFNDLIGLDVNATAQSVFILRGMRLLHSSKSLKSTLSNSQKLS